MSEPLNFAVSGATDNAALRLSRLARLLTTARRTLASNNSLSKVQRDELNAALDRLGGPQ